MTDYLDTFYQKIVNASGADLVGLYQNFSLPDYIKHKIETRTRNSFDKLWANPDFRLYLFYRLKNRKNIIGSSDWLTTTVAKAMGISDLKQPNRFKSQDNCVAYYKDNTLSGLTLNLSENSLESEPAELMDTIFHELTHELQAKVNRLSNDTWDKIIHFNNVNYIGHKIDPKAYRCQPVEAEAYLVGEIIQKLVQEKCATLSKKNYLEYPDDNVRENIYGFTINPYQYWEAAYNMLKKEKRTKNDCQDQFRTVLGYLDKAIDYGRFVNNGTCARDAIGFLASLANLPKFQKHIPDIQDRIITVFNKYKDDQSIKQKIKNATIQLGRQKLQIMCSEPENTQGRVMTYNANTPDR